MTQYFGGKKRLGSAIAAVIARFRTSTAQPYYEPFVGMAGVMQHVDGAVRRGFDAHADLVAMWRALLEDGWRPPETVTLDDYTRLKASYRACVQPDGSIDAERTPRTEAALRAFVGFGCCWSGIYFGNFDPVKVHRARNSVLASLPGMLGVEVRHLRYESLDLDAPGAPRALVYCDIPYVSESGQVNHYRGTARFRPLQFWSAARQWTSLGHTVLVSERHAPEDFVAVWSQEYCRRFKKPTQRYDAPCARDAEQVFVHRSVLGSAALPPLLTESSTITTTATTSTKVEEKKRKRGLSRSNTTTSCACAKERDET